MLLFLIAQHVTLSEQAHSEITNAHYYSESDKLVLFKKFSTTLFNG